MLNQVGPDLRVCGEVVFFSDRGGEKAHFAIISAPGVETPLIVPVSKLEPATGEPEAAPDGAVGFTREEPVD
ncbi:MAG: hypothetical protein GY778_26410 [bacterium]|nr:hypothetical protein [bacterium]